MATSAPDTNVTILGVRRQRFKKRRIETKNVSIPSHNAEWAAQVAAYYKFIRPNEDERVRIVFSILLLPLALSYPKLETPTNPELREALVKSQEAYLARIADADQLIDLGRYIVWGVEREAIARALRERFCALIVPSTFDGRQLRYGTLIRVATEVRNRTVLTDFDHGMSQSGGDPELGRYLALASLATSFTKRVLNIDLTALDPGAPNFSPQEGDRFKRSILLATEFHSRGFIAVGEIFRKIGAYEGAK